MSVFSLNSYCIVLYCNLTLKKLEPKCNEADMMYDVDHAHMRVFENYMYVRKNQPHNSGSKASLLHIPMGFLHISTPVSR